MKLVQIYKCLCDETRLRILNLLGEGELCVCHVQAVLGMPQVKVSKHLAYLRRRGLVIVRRDGNWMNYRLPLSPSGELASNLACLQDCIRENAVFVRDRARLDAMRVAARKKESRCCGPGGRAKAIAR
jgi:ArsR family transcriptional regulator